MNEGVYLLNIVGNISAQQINRALCSKKTCNFLGIRF